MREIDEALDGRSRLSVRRHQHRRNPARLHRLSAPHERAARPSSPSTPSAAPCSGAWRARGGCRASAPESRRRLSKRIEPDRLIRVSDIDSVVACRRLVRREAIFAGASAGAVAAARARSLRRMEPGSRCARSFHDGGTGYLDSVYDDGWVERELGYGPDDVASDDRRTARRRGGPPQPASVRVAIVGCGPKGLFALERLLAHAAAANGEELVIDVFEPHPAPGAGPVYDPDQPEFLRMNFSAAMIDMWWRGGRPGRRLPAGRLPELAWQPDRRLRAAGGGRAVSRRRPRPAAAGTPHRDRAGPLSPLRRRIDRRGGWSLVAAGRRRRRPRIRAGHGHDRTSCPSGAGR